MIGTDGEKEAGKSVLAVRLDDDELLKNIKSLIIYDFQVTNYNPK